MNPKVLFIRGPIPFEWLISANQLGPSTGLVGISLWFYVGLNSKYKFKLDGKLDKLTGLSRQTRQSALSKLHEAGLIELNKHPGAYPHIRVIPPRGGNAKPLGRALIPVGVISYNASP
jgi:hypothetical protein